MATEKIEKSLYNGEVNITFYPNSHQYKKDGETIMSVSTICGVVDKSQALIYRATNLAKDYLLGIKNRTDDEVIRACQLYKEKKDEAADIGTLAHEWAEKYIKTGEMTLPDDPKVANAISGFLNWKAEYKVEFTASEKLVYSRKHNYVGICDGIGIIDGKKYLIDFKTSNSIYLLTYGMQTVAYMKAYEEETGDKLDGVIIVKFAKDEFDKKGNPIPSFEVQEIVDIEYMYNAFLSAKVLKEAVKKYDKF